MRIVLSGLITLSFFVTLHGQNVGINTDGSIPTMMLDIKPASSASDGIRINNPNTGDGDAILNFQNGGVDVWTIGFDDSDGDAFKLSNGLALTTNNYLNVETDGKVGVNTAVPAARLHVAESSSSVPGLVVEKNNADDALQLNIINTTGGAGNAIDINFNSNTVNSSAVWLKNYGDFAGYNVENYGDANGIQVRQYSTTTTASGVYVINESAVGPGITVNSDDYLGVDIVVTNAGDPVNAYTGNGYGGVFISANGDGLIAWGDSGNNSGVYGYAGSGDGLIGETGDPVADYAIIGFGDMAATGAKFFVIDHPIEPGNKILRHFSMESDEPLLVYRGMEKFDKNGEVVVQLQDYISAININYTYNLTPVGEYMPVFISKEVDDKGLFIISGGKEGAFVSWTLYGQRHDAYFQKYPEKLNPEVNKSAEQIGKFLDPRSHSKPLNKGYNAEKYKVVEEIEERSQTHVKISEGESGDHQTKE